MICIRSDQIRSEKRRKRQGEGRERERERAHRALQHRDNQPPGGAPLPSSRACIFCCMGRDLYNGMRGEGDGEG